MRKFAIALAAPLLVGAVLTIALARAGMYEVLAGVWLMLYGSGLLTGGAFSIRLVALMGASFLALGVVTTLAPGGWGPAAMVAGVRRPPRAVRAARRAESRWLSRPAAVRG